MDDLKLSDLSTLDPQARLRQSRGQYGRMLLKAQAGDVDAIAGLSGAAQSYLQEARGYYASNASYARIFDNVTSNLERLDTTLTGQGSATERASTAADTLAESLQTLADKINSLEIAQTATFNRQVRVNSRAAGGMTQGLTLVGENGPEMINFAYPTMVSNNNATRSMIGNSNDAVVAELRKQNDQLTEQIRTMQAAYTAMIERMDRIANSNQAIERKTKVAA